MRRIARYVMVALLRLTLLLVPARWRDSVQRDLIDESPSRPGWKGEAWRAWQTMRIGVRFRLGRRHSKPLSTRTPMFSGLGTDLRLASRLLLRQPWSSLSIAVTLALGIGATTAIYGVFNFVLFRPIPGVSDQDSIVTVIFESQNHSTTGYGQRAALPALRAAAQGTGLEFLGDACCGSALAVTRRGTDPEFVNVDFVTGQYFDALGVSATRGRLLTDDEADSGSQDLVVISEHFWRTKFGGATNAVGQALSINGRSFVVVGVARRFRGWDYITRVGKTDLWLPIGSQKSVTGQGSSLYRMSGRLRPGSSLIAVQRQLQDAYGEAVRTKVSRDAGFLPFAYAGMWPMAVGGASPLHLYTMLMAGVAILLALSCANSANLLLARAARRERENAVRLAIGAGRWRVVRQLLVESICLGLVAGGLGLLCAELLTSSLAGTRILSYFPDLAEIELDTRVFGFCLAVTSGTILAFGLGPALIASRVDVRTVLSRGGRGVAPAHRLRHGLMIAQVGLSLALITSAIALNRSLQNLLSTDVGAELDHVLALSLRPDNINGYDRTKAARVIVDTMDELRRAGFRDVAVSYSDPLTTNASSVKFQTTTMAQAERKVVNDNSVSPDIFAVLRIPVLYGRALTTAEYGESDRVSPMSVVLNATLARDLFGGPDRALGQSFALERSSGMTILSSTAVVVGVVGDTRSAAVRGAARPALFHGRLPSRRYGTVFIRFDGPAGEAVERVRRVVREVDPALPITSVGVFRETIADEISEDRLLARLSALVALLAVVLASTGVISVIGQLVTERTKDFGIRTTLGASRADIVGHVLAGVVTRSAMGIVLGLAFYATLARWLSSKLFELSALDPLILTGAAAGLLFVVVLSALIPARRAAGIDPAVALRAE